jgi:uncharacterized membrane protein
MSIYNLKGGNKKMKTNLRSIKKAVVGLDVVESVIFSLLVIGVIAVASLLAMYSLGSSNIFATNSAGYNNTQFIVNNFSNGVTGFFGNSTTFFSILAVVVIIALIALIVLYIRQFRNEGNRATA